MTRRHHDPDPENHAAATRIDVHQHLWSERLCAALAARSETPRLRRDGAGWALELAGEPPFALAGPESAERRAELLGVLGVDVAVVALSSALGAETLPDDEARSLIAAWDDDAGELPAALWSWGSVPLERPDPSDVDAALDRGRVGIVLPATELASPAQLDRLGPLLERLADRGAPLFVHPGPSAPGTWLPALTGYVASLSAAWHAWVLHGRWNHPRLRVLFAALAGLAPLHGERLGARTSGVDVRSALADANVFYETSSYGPAAIESLLRVVAPTALVHGSDWPYAHPGASTAQTIARNPAALFAPAAVGAA